MKIEKQIRAIAASKVQVGITRRKKSKTGFLAMGPDRKEKHFCPTKKEALAWLLVKARLTPVACYTVVVASVIDKTGVQKDVPVPPARTDKTGLTTVLRSMNPGESLWTEYKITNQVSPILAWVKRKYSKNFIARESEGGVRIWCIPNE